MKIKAIIETNSSSSLPELIQNGRLLTLPLAAGDLHSLLPDEDGRHLYVAMKDNLLSTSSDDITQNPRKVRAALLLISSFHLGDRCCSLSGSELVAACLNSDEKQRVSSRWRLLLFIGA